MLGSGRDDDVSLGLPSHLARPANSRALATAARWAGLICLAAAVVNVGSASLADGNVTSWVTLLVLVPMVALLLALARGRTAGLTIAYLLVGTVCTYFYVVALFIEPVHHLLLGCKIALCTITLLKSGML